MGIPICLMAVIGSIGHLICLNIICKEKKLLKIPRFLIIACMSVANMVFNATVSIGYIIATQISEGFLCEIMADYIGLLGTIAFHIYLALSAVLAVDQLIAISYGLLYKSIVTLKRVKKAVAITLAVLTLMNLLSLLEYEERVIIQCKMRKSRFILHTLLVWLCVICTVVSIAKGYSISSKKLRNLRPDQRDLSYWSKRKRIRNEITILGLIKVIFLLPFGLYYPKLLSVNSPESDRYGMQALRILMLIFCTWNAVLYLATFRELRQGFIALLKRNISQTRTIRTQVHPSCTQNPFDENMFDICAISPEVIEMVTFRTREGNDDQAQFVKSVMEENLDNYHTNNGNHTFDLV